MTTKLARAMSTLSVSSPPRSSMKSRRVSVAKSVITVTSDDEDVIVLSD